jgi:hypothetical protein
MQLVGIQSGVMGDSNAWIGERRQECTKRLVSPRMRVHIRPIYNEPHGEIT